MRVSIIGSGYVGLISGVCLAEKGHQVVCVDLDAKKVKQINEGKPPMYERGLEVLLKKNVDVSLRATTDLHESVIQTDVSLIAVGTPFDGGHIDLTYVKQASFEIGKALRDKSAYHMVVVKSTVVPGTTDEVILPILEEASGKRAGNDFGVGMNPEFLAEGGAVKDFMHPDRVVLGGIDKRSVCVLEDLYSVFDNVDLIKTNNRTAEMIKYTSNALFATMISFSNEIANLCTAIGGIDIVDVMKAVHLDKRLSPRGLNGHRVVPTFTTYLEAGCGFGGSCFPKDLKALIAHGEKAGVRMEVLNAVNQVNDQQPRQILALLQKHFPCFKGLVVAVLGLAFKPGTDDMRESPAIPIINELLHREARIKAYDPVVRGESQKLPKNADIVFCDDLAQAIENAHAVLLLTRWEEFLSLPTLLADLKVQPLIIDGRRMLNKRDVARYEGIGLRGAL